MKSGSKNCLWTSEEGEWQAMKNQVVTGPHWCNILSVFMRNNVLSNAALFCSTHHTNVLLLFEVVLPIFTGSSSWLKAQLHSHWRL